MNGRLTIGSRVISDLIWGSRLRHSPRELGGDVAAGVALKVVSEITGIVYGCSLNTRAQAA
jgi:hypothetical protein